MIDLLKPCFPGTCTEILDNFIQWTNDIDNPNKRVSFLVGGAGMGKSSIAYSITQHFQRFDRLGAFFPFTSNIKGNRQLRLFSAQSPTNLHSGALHLDMKSSAATIYHNEQRGPMGSAHTETCQQTLSFCWICSAGDRYIGRKWNQ